MGAALALGAPLRAEAAGARPEQKAHRQSGHPSRLALSVQVSGRYNWDMLLEDMPNAGDAVVTAGADDFFSIGYSGGEADSLSRLWGDSA
mmetsp:Transcript_10676/g.18321  ORF Transcript_10676/g.18321 Transcript_10676/m.18321 type:complete len:90 (-) Transcript_10676:29-298(-)